MNSEDLALIEALSAILDVLKQGSYYLIQTNNGLNSDPVQTKKSMKFRPKSDHNRT